MDTGLRGTAIAVSDAMSTASTIMTSGRAGLGLGLAGCVVAATSIASLEQKQGPEKERFTFVTG